MTNVANASRWKQKYRKAPEPWMNPDPIPVLAFSEDILPLIAGVILRVLGGSGVLWVAS